MRLVYKLTACLLAGICALFALFGYLTVQREVAMFDVDMRRDAHLVCQTLSQAVERLWASRAEQTALALIERASHTHDKMEFRVVEVDALDLTGMPSGTRERLRRGVEVVEREVRSGGVLCVLRPLNLPSGPPRVLELTESLESERAYVHATVVRIATAGVLGALLTTGLAFLLGTRVVGQPMRQLTDKVHRVGRGDLSGPVVLRQRDEIGHLAGAINAMCEELKVAREELAAETDRRIDALEQLRHAERLATIGRLAAGVAHELGTPLNVIMGRAKLIRVGDPTGAARTDNAAVIEEQSRRIKTTIDQLLGFARRRQAHPTPTDLRAVVRHAASLLEPLTGKAQVRIDLTLGEPLELRLDSSLMQQVITNLLVNATHASAPEGTIEVALDVREATPPPGHAGSAGPYACLRVCDRGAGIAPEDLPRIFEPFFTTKDVGEGTGLGLPLAHGIVAEHGGWIAVESELGVGSTFSVFLPLQEVTVNV